MSISSDHRYEIMVLLVLISIIAINRYLYGFFSFLAEGLGDAKRKRLPGRLLLSKSTRKMCSGELDNLILMVLVAESAQSLQKNMSR